MSVLRALPFVPGPAARADASSGPDRSSAGRSSADRSSAGGSAAGFGEAMSSTAPPEAVATVASGPSAEAEGDRTPEDHVADLPRAAASSQGTTSLRDALVAAGLGSSPSSAVSPEAVPSQDGSAVPLLPPVAEQATSSAADPASTPGQALDPSRDGSATTSTSSPTRGELPQEAALTSTGSVAEPSRDGTPASADRPHTSLVEPVGGSDEPTGLVGATATATAAAAAATATATATGATISSGAPSGGWSSAAASGASPATPGPAAAASASSPAPAGFPTGPAATASARPTPVPASSASAVPATALAPATGGPATGGPATGGPATGGASTAADRARVVEAGVATTTTGASSALSVAPPVVAVPGATASAAAAGSTALAAPPAAPAPLTQQLARPLFSLAAAGAGTHVVTVTVSPEALGPVTVRAHVGAHGMHVEMFAPTDAGREAVRAILPDLRRDLGGAGLAASVDLSSQNQPSDDRADQQRLLDQRAEQQGRQGQQSPHDEQGRAGEPRDALGRLRRDDLDPAADRLRAGALAAAAGAVGPHRASSSPTVSIDVLA